MSLFWQNYHYWLHLIMTTCVAASDENFSWKWHFNFSDVFTNFLYRRSLMQIQWMLYDVVSTLSYHVIYRWCTLMIWKCNMHLKFIDGEICYLRFTYDEGLYWMCVNITTCWGYCNIKVDPFHTLMSPSSWGAGPIKHNSQNICHAHVYTVMIRETSDAPCWNAGVTK